MKTEFRDADSSSQFSRRGLALLVSLIARNTLIARRFKTLGESLDFHMFVKSNWGDGVKFFQTRELLWKEIMGHVEKPANFFEFGVAHGYLTDFFFTNFEEKIKSWKGYDRFEGLPTSWRELSEGSFSNNGLPPEINDRRIKWHIGDIEDTFDATTIDSGTNIYIFDLDLYEPSKFAWDVLKSKLSSGDILYFDEAFDADERRLIREEILKNNLKLVGWTPLALALKV